MRTALGNPVVATLLAPADPPPDMGARIEVPYTRQIVSFWQPAVLTEIPDPGWPDPQPPPAPLVLAWTVALEPPVVVGDYLIVFRTGTNEETEAVGWTIPLFVG